MDMYKDRKGHASFITPLKKLKVYWEKQNLLEWEVKHNAS